MLNDVEAAKVKVDGETACPGDAPVALTRADLISETTPISSDALFATGRSDLGSGAIQTLDQLLQQIKDTPKVVEIRIEGHTDNTGTDMINLPLSKARAQKVRDYMVLNGLETANIHVEGYGASRPVGDNATEAGRSANRRVEVVVTRER
jgi:adhesin transport system outer membrane protein